MAEQRRSRRLGFLKHLVVIRGKSEGYLEDLTQGGAGLVMIRVPRIGETLQFTIQFHSCLKLPLLHLEGFVRWVSVCADGSARVGLELTKPDAQSKTVITRYMAHASRVQSGRDALA